VLVLVLVIVIVIVIDSVFQFFWIVTLFLGISLITAEHD